jgi:rubrerythrin
MTPVRTWTTDPTDPEVSGPHPGYDRYGRLDHYYYRCERCGHETTNPDLRRGCPRCRVRTGA